jgi:hypothetical protein
LQAGNLLSQVVVPCVIVLMVTGRKVEIQLISEYISAVGSIISNTEMYHIRISCHHMVWSKFREIFGEILQIER